MFTDTGSFVAALASDPGSAAGGAPTISVFDELWAFTSERARRFWDELLPTPTKQISARLTVTYAGFSGESELLEDLYRRGIELPEVGPDLRAGDGMLFFWTHIHELRRIDYVELAARGLSNYGPTGKSIADQVQLPAFKIGETDVPLVWPPQADPLAIMRALFPGMVVV